MSDGVSSLELLYAFCESVRQALKAVRWHPSQDLAYRSDFRDVYYSTETLSTEPEWVYGKCAVLQAGAPIGENCRPSHALLHCLIHPLLFLRF